MVIWPPRLRGWGMHRVWILAIAGAAISLAFGAQAQAQVSVRAAPDRPYAETTAAGVAINVDLIAQNSSGAAYELTELHLDVLGSGGRLLQRRELNGNGTSPSIQIVAERRLESDSFLMIYNPLPAFPADVPVRRLDFGLVFQPVDGGAPLSVRVSVQPRPAPVARFTLPLVGRILVWDGHDFTSHHRRWNYRLPPLVRAGYRGNAGRYAYDLVPVDAAGERSHGNEAENRSWLGFWRSVRASAAGTVVAVHATAPDDRTFHRDLQDANSIFGNYVVLRHDDGSFSLFGHLMQASVSVRLGQRVRSGQPLGRVGASGDSLFPHLHFQRADGPNDLSEGIPVTWTGVMRDSARPAPLPNGYLDTGDIVLSP
jgi:hypothetical protein